MAQQGNDTPAPRAGVPELAARAALDFVQVAGLFAISFAQPVIDLLRSNEIIGQGWTHPQAIATAVAFLGVPAGVSALASLLVGLVNKSTGRALHIAVLAVLMGVFAAHLVKRGAPGAGVTMAVAFVAAAALGGVAYARLEPVRTFFGFLGVAPLLVLLPLVFSTYATPLRYAGEPRAGAASSSDVPVVLVVMDELPVTSLEDGRGRLERRRVPNFFRFARDATWFPNATSVSDETVQAVPAIINGRTPNPKARRAPSGNLFTLMSGSHEENVQESVTRLCPPGTCPQSTPAGLRARLEGLRSLVWKASWDRFLPKSLYDKAFPKPPTAASFPERQLLAMAQGIKPSSPKPQFSFVHLLLPHSPWLRVPDGRRYDTGLSEKAWLPGFKLDPIFGFPLVKDDTLSPNAGVVAEAQQAHLAQAGAADRLLGFVLDRLKQTRQYDKSLIVVLADHGAAFVPGRPFRRLTRATGPQILGIPLFVKRPGQRRGGIDAKYARSTDVLPTIARASGLRVPFHIDGRPLFSPRPRARTLSAVSKYTGKTERFTPSYLAGGRARVRAAQARLFGPGTDAVELFRLGPRPGLIGRSTAAARAAGLRPAAVQLERVAALRHVDPRAQTVPASISATTGAVPAGRVYAVALNGRIVATTRSYRVNGKTRLSVLAPPAAIRAGANRVQILAVS